MAAGSRRSASAKASAFILVCSANGKALSGRRRRDHCGATGSCRPAQVLAGMASCRLPPALGFLKAPLAVARAEHAVFIVVDTQYHGVRISMRTAPIGIVRPKEHSSLNCDQRLERVNQLPETLVARGVAVVVLRTFCLLAVSAAKPSPHAIQFRDVRRHLRRAPAIFKEL